MIFIKQVNNFLTKEECDLIIKKAITETTLEESEVYSSKTGNVINHNSRKSKQSYLDLPEIKERIINYLSNEIKIKGKKLGQLEKNFQFVKYDVNSHFDWHTDSNDSDMTKRFCTVVIQLNDEYEGGQLMYKKDTTNFKYEHDSVLEFERGIGNLFVFNSSLEHAVKPITQGIRYSLVVWFTLTEESVKTLL